MDNDIFTMESSTHLVQVPGSEYFMAYFETIQEYG